MATLGLVQGWIEDIGNQAMKNIDKEIHWAWTVRLDRIAIPLWLAGATLDAAYREALRTYEIGIFKDGTDRQRSYGVR